MSTILSTSTSLDKCSTVKNFCDINFSDLLNENSPPFKSKSKETSVDQSAKLVNMNKNGTSINVNACNKTLNMSKSQNDIFSKHISETSLPIDSICEKSKGMNNEVGNNTYLNENLLSIVSDYFNEIPNSTQAESNAEEECKKNNNTQSINYLRSYIAQDGGHISEKEKNTDQLAYPNILECVSNWRKIYPWVSLKDKTNELFCETCSINPDFLIIIWEVQSQNQLFETASNLLNHSNSAKHKAATLLLSNAIFSDAIYGVLKKEIFNFENKYQLFCRIKDVASSFNIVLDDIAITEIICIIGLLIMENVKFNLKSRKNYGVSFTVDSCRKLLIARYSNYMNSSEEHVLFDFMEYPVSFPTYFTKNNIEIHDSVFLNFNVQCETCFLQEKAYDVNNTLPPKMPKYESLLNWLIKDNYFGEYAQFVSSFKNLASYCPKVSSLLQTLNLINCRWTNCELYKLIVTNYDSLKFDFHCILINTGGEDARFCFNFDMKVYETILFSKLIYFLSYLFKSRIANFDLEHFQTLYALTPYKLPKLFSLTIIDVFCQEVKNKGYALGSEHLIDFIVFCQPLVLQNLSVLFNENNINKSVYLKVFCILKHHISVTFYKFVNNLILFGKFLYDKFKSASVSFQNILNMFYYDVNVQKKYPIMFKMYYLLSLFPCYLSPQEKSFFEVWAISQTLIPFGPSLKTSLLAVIFEGP